MCDTKKEVFIYITAVTNGVTETQIYYLDSISIAKPTNRHCCRPAPRLRWN